jgi:hypothetical protein
MNAGTDKALMKTGRIRLGNYTERRVPCLNDITNRTATHKANATYGGGKITTTIQRNKKKKNDSADTTQHGREKAPESLP